MSGCYGEGGGRSRAWLQGWEVLTPDVFWGRWLRCGALGLVHGCRVPRAGHRH